MVNFVAHTLLGQLPTHLTQVVSSAYGAIHPTFWEDTGYYSLSTIGFPGWPIPAPEPASIRRLMHCVGSTALEDVFTVVQADFNGAKGRVRRLLIFFFFSLLPKHSASVYQEALEQPDNNGLSGLGLSRSIQFGRGKRRDQPDGFRNCPDKDQNCKQLRSFSLLVCLTDTAVSRRDLGLLRT
jgi:hypothetical protein